MANYGARTAAQATARRNELARRKGFRSYPAYRKASKADREAASRRAAEAGAYKTPTAARQAVEQVAEPERRLIDMGGGRQQLRSMRNRELYAFLVRAEKRDLRVWAFLDLADGSQVQLWRRGGIDPSYILDELRAARSRDVVAWLAQYLSAGAPAGQNTLGRSPRLRPPTDDDEPEDQAPEIEMVQLSSGIARGAEGEAA